MKKWIFAFLIVQTIGCSNETPSNAPVKDTISFQPLRSYPLKPVLIYQDNGDDKGPGDFALSIVAIRQTDTSTRYKALSSWNNKNLGLLINIPKNEGKGGFGTGFTLQSIGAESDHFLQFMAERYAQKINAKTHFKSTSLAYVNLQSLAKTLTSTENDKSISQYKIFFEDPKTGANAELYINIDVRNNQIQFEEKDPEYRSELIKFLQQ